MRRNRVSRCLFGMILSTAILLIAPGARAQAPSPTPSPAPAATASPTLESQFFKNVLSDQKAIWTAPFHVHQRDMRWLVPLGFGTAALIATDRRSGDEMAESRAQLNPSHIISYAGSDYALGATAATFYLIGRSTHNDRARETGILGAEALLDSAIVVTALKEVTQRRRPTAARGRSDFWDGGSSFPSGHSIEAWALASVVADEYSDHRLVQVAAYGIASAVSISRFTGRNHYLSDVLVGSALGYGIGHYVFHAHHVNRSATTGGEEEEESLNGPNRWPSIAPTFNRHAHNYGVALTWSF